MGSTVKFAADPEDEPDDEPIDRHEALTTLLGQTARGGVPIRGAFIQTKKKRPDGTRRGPLAEFTGDAPALEAYLLIHAMASSSAPYSSSYPAVTWAHISDMTRHAGIDSARQRWSKAVQKLKKLNLIEASREGRGMKYTLLHESGNGSAYTRPKSLDATHGGWVTLPYDYWLQGFDRALTLPEKVMLLIALDQKEPFELPIPSMPDWYGIPTATAQRGLEGLVQKGVLAKDKRSEFNLKSAIHRRVVNVYTPIGMWTKDSRKATMTIARPPAGSPSFTATVTGKKATTGK